MSSHARAWLAEQPGQINAQLRRLLTRSHVTVCSSLLWPRRALQVCCFKTPVRAPHDRDAVSLARSVRGRNACKSLRDALRCRASRRAKRCTRSATPPNRPRAGSNPVGPRSTNRRLHAPGRGSSSSCLASSHVPADTSIPASHAHLQHRNRVTTTLATRLATIERMREVATTFGSCNIEKCVPDRGVRWSVRHKKGPHAT